MFVDYAASKAALKPLTVARAGEVGKDGVRVNAVRPGIIEMDIHARTRQVGLPTAFPWGGREPPRS